MKQTGALKAATHLFCFISFIGIYYPLTDIVIVHIVYINESNPYSPHAPCERRVARRRGARAGSVSESNPRPNLKMREVQTVTLDGFWKQDYGWGVRVCRHFGERGMSSVRYGTQTCHATKRGRPCWRTKDNQSRCPVGCLDSVGSCKDSTTCCTWPHLVAVTRPAQSESTRAYTMSIYCCPCCASRRRMCSMCHLLLRCSSGTLKSLLGSPACAPENPQDPPGALPPQLQTLRACRRRSPSLCRPPVSEMGVW